MAATHSVERVEEGDRESEREEEGGEAREGQRGRDRERQDSDRQRARERETEREREREREREKGQDLVIGGNGLVLDHVRKPAIQAFGHQLLTTPFDHTRLATRL
jgi:type VI protein secretion system component VasA